MTLNTEYTCWRISDFSQSKKSRLYEGRMEKQWWQNSQNSSTCGVDSPEPTLEVLCPSFPVTSVWMLSPTVFCAASMHQCNYGQTCTMRWRIFVGVTRWYIRLPAFLISSLLSCSSCIPQCDTQTTNGMLMDAGTLDAEQMAKETPFWQVSIELNCLKKDLYLSLSPIFTIGQSVINL